MRDWNVDAVMTRDVVCVDPGTPRRELEELFSRNKIGALPVVDVFERVVGVVAESDLHRRRRRGRWGLRRGPVPAGSPAGGLMGSPPIVVRGGTSLAVAARLMAERRVKRLPVVDDLGRLVGIVARCDLLKVHLRPDDEIREDIETGVLWPYLAEERGLRVGVRDGVVTLTGRAGFRSSVAWAVRVLAHVPGVVDVVEVVAYDVDDCDLPGAV